MLHRRIAIAALFLLAPARQAAAVQAGLDLSFPVNFPKFIGFEATIQINGEPCFITVRLAPDERGKYGCTPGGCTVNDIPVVASGSLKPRLGPDGGLLYFYSASLKSAPEASEKVVIKVSGELTSGVATFKYSGPKGKETLTGHPIDILADLGLSLGSVSLSPELIKPGKLGGTGSLELGLGNDPNATGPLKVSIKPTAISIALKVGARKVSFKANEIQDGDWVGTLQVVAKPAKFAVEDFAVPAAGLLAPPAPSGGRCSEKSGDAFNGVLLLNMSLFNDSQTNAGSADFYRTPAGNLFVNVGMGYRQDFILGDKNCLSIDLPPKSPGPWFCLKVDIYDINTNTTKDFGTICFEVTDTFPFIRGRWVLLDQGGSQADTGGFLVGEPVCGQPAGGPILDAILRTGEQTLGSFSLVPTTGGAVTMDVAISLEGQNIQSTIFCLDIDPAPQTKGDWFCAPIEVINPVTLLKEPFGEICMTVTGTSPYFEGGWTINDLGGKEVVSGTWKSQIPVCGQITGAAALQASFPDQALGSLGTLTLYPTSGGKVAVEANLVFDSQQYSVSQPCADIDTAKSSPGAWFTVEASVWDPSGGDYIPAGTLDIDLDAATPKRMGSWTLNDLGGGKIGSGQWEEFD